MEFSMSQNKDGDEQGKSWGLIVLIIFFILALLGPIISQIFFKE